MQYRGFAAARGTKQNDPLFCLYLQGQRVDDLPPMVLLAYGSKLDHAHGGRPARFCQRAPTKSGSSVTAIKMTEAFGAWRRKRIVAETGNRTQLGEGLD